MSDPASSRSPRSSARTRGVGRRERLARRVEELLSLRTEANERFFEAAAEPLARLSHGVAERFAREGRLLALGGAPQARTDARHLAAAFVHPMIAGGRALPALALTGEDGALRERLELIAEPRDVVIAFGDDRETAGALGAAARRGCLTAAFAAIGAEWELAPAASDPFVRQELVQAASNLLWEFVRVVSAQQAGDREGAIAGVRDSIRQQAHETALLRVQTLGEGRDALIAAAIALRERFDAGATVLALGNGVSATDAIDAIADFRDAAGGWVARRAIDLTGNTAIVTGIANDIGVEAIFRRQVAAYGRVGDILLVLCTGGGSLNLIEALAEARERKLATIAMVGCDGGRIAAEGLADHVLVTRSRHLSRTQEAQASARHVLRQLVEEAA